MLTPPTAPSPGKPVSAGFFSRLIAWVKSGMLIEGPGYRLNRGPNGTALVLQQSNQTNKTSSTGCFEIEKINIEDRTVKLINCYYQIGGYTYNGEENFLDGSTGFWSYPCTVKDGLAYLCVVLPSVGLQSAGIYLMWYSWHQLVEAQSIVSKYIIPLYAFYTSEKEEGSKFNLYLDMRNAPRAQMIEFGVE